MVVPIANLSALVTGAMDAAKAVATELVPAAVKRDAVVEATKASAAWAMQHLWAWLAIARAVAADTLPAGAAAAASHAASSAVEAASGPWVHAAARLLRGVYGWLVTAAVQKLPDVTVEKLLSDAAAWFVNGHRVALYVTLALVLLAITFLGGAVWALTCRTMKGPGLGGARVPRAVFEASPKRYYATVRSAKKAQRRGATGTGCSMLCTGFLVAVLAFLTAKVLC